MTACLLLAIGLAVTAVHAGERAELDAGVAAALEAFSRELPEGEALLREAKGVLVFPEVVKVGFGIGGEYGEGALLIGGDQVAYYSTSGASFGLQLGAQARSHIILFMTRSALAKFRRSKGWEVGVDGSIALVGEGAGDGIDTLRATEPVIGFVFSNRGLMYNLTLEGSKITPLDG
jgi:lipid-binding SYLF domain-containing protein